MKQICSLYISLNVSFFSFLREESEFLNGTCIFFITHTLIRKEKGEDISYVFENVLLSLIQSNLIPSFERYERKGNIIDY